MGWASLKIKFLLCKRWYEENEIKKSPRGVSISRGPRNELAQCSNRHPEDQELQLEWERGRAVHKRQRNCLAQLM